ncbi:MAG: hypothetical protein GX490_03175, partial [Bacilli bacterium]|nr:hypothetical protein [Bacilli bacterium]
ECLHKLNEYNWCSTCVEFVDDKTNKLNYCSYCGSMLTDYWCDECQVLFEMETPNASKHCPYCDTMLETNGYCSNCAKIVSEDFYDDLDAEDEDSSDNNNDDGLVSNVRKSYYDINILSII